MGGGKAIEKVEGPEDLRRMIRQCEIAVAQLEGSGAEALSLLKLLDEIKDLMQRLEERGADLEPEKVRMQTVEGLLRSKVPILLKEMRAVGGLDQARQEVSPDESRWWWYLDRQVAEQRRGTMRRWLTIGGVAVAILVALGGAYSVFFAPSPEARERHEHLTRAEDFREDGDLAAALAEYEAARALAPDEPEIHLWLGVLYGEEGREDKAAAAFATARKLLGNEVEFLVRRGMIYAQMDKVEATLTDASAATALDPKSAMAHFLLGGAYEAQEKIPEALEEFERAAELADQAGNNTLVAQARMRAGMLLQRAPVLPSPTDSGD
jgi:tetratricopeptide (TPR) repeat protein